MILSKRLSLQKKNVDPAQIRGCVCLNATVNLWKNLHTMIMVLFFRLGGKTRKGITHEQQSLFNSSYNFIIKLTGMCMNYI